MRDRRFIAEHRGGPLARRHHQLLSAWAADCGEHVLPLFLAHATGDDRPRRAIDTARAWARGEVRVGVAQKAAVASHAAARQCIAAGSDPSAVAAARSAGHAVATAHFADHSLGAAVYALKAVHAAGQDVAAERSWQIERLPAEVSDLVIAALQTDRMKRAGPR
ncbi:putative immunity protein [Humisphaera borealis]|uniref:Imm-5-like domain-containing protein n=1 Tax=Humisphaera borealis TaxID=2807512 RepID=A0A7M2WXM4_9BACT|nr:hypothetical protein [Humisphaera borealis]QOV90159.1 hypothetical protein IPV69_01935 [Humisphaera borealis]